MRSTSRRTNPAFWAFVPVLLSLSLVATWAAIHYGPLGKPTAATTTCNDVRTFIQSEESAGKSEWQQYRTLVDQLGNLANTSNDRVPLIRQIVTTLVGVLGHDLAIYQQLDQSISCVKLERRSDIPGLVSDTKNTIDFLQGKTAIEGNYFDPSNGFWPADFYSEYLSAVDLLKSGS
ncbi:MAG: hypothetical protein RLZZ251_840 [Actinomycetota bacterium]